MKTLISTLAVAGMIAFAPFSQAAELNINTASAAQLTQLKGIGDMKAQAIVEWRKNQGPFTSVDQLTEIKGIGPNTLKRMDTTLTLGGKNQPTESVSQAGNNASKTEKPGSSSKAITPAGADKTVTSNDS